MPDVRNMFYMLKSLGRYRRKCTYNFYRCFSEGRLKSTSKEYRPWKIIFYGTDQFSEVTLKALDFNRLSTDSLKVVQSLEIVCKEVFEGSKMFSNELWNSDCAVRRYALLSNLTIHTWPFDISPDVYDVGIVVSFGNMIPSSSIVACKYGIINAHPSILPRWRGAAPIFHTILNGDDKSGVTITQVSPNKFDVGNILMQEHYLIPERCTAKKLDEDLSKIAADLIMKTLKNLPEYIESSYPQPTEGATLARKIKPHKCCINWAEDSAIVVDRKFRAYDGSFDLHTTWKDLKIVILDIVSPEEVAATKILSLVKDSVHPGFCYFHKKRKIVLVKCQDGWSGIKMLRIPKRGKITALDFYNGFMSKEDPDKCYLH